MVRVQRVAVWIDTSTLMQVTTKSSVFFEKSLANTLLLEHWPLEGQQHPLSVLSIVRWCLIANWLI